MKMLDFKDKSLKLGILTLLMLSACSTSENVDINQINNQNIINTSSVTELGNINIKFNDAYKGLYTENEMTGNSSATSPDKAFIQIINSAKSSLDLAIFDIDDKAACGALIKAHKRGVKVRIVTDSDNFNDKIKSSMPRQVLEDMKAVGIEIKGDNRTALMHSKFVIMDNNTVITGSSNLTHNSLFRDNNNVLKIHSIKLSTDYTAEFNRMFEQGIFGPNKHEIPFQSVNVDGTNIRPFFSPKGGAKAAIIDELKKAKKSIKFMAFSFTDKDIELVINNKIKAGVKIEGIFDGCMISPYSLYKTFNDKKIPVYIDGNQALLHDKVFIIDGNTVITGSYNFSNNAEENNNESTLIIKSVPIATQYIEEYQKLKFASINNKNIPPYDNRNCSSTSLGNTNSNEVEE
ncbi:MAG: hypothetical protein H7263_01835 [Candidatus Sericytochromatia bacterium]|nr:hypothetical protein [Candidatus Sericytochromatia bacterium]